ncbi:alpha/beta hydrolase [Pedobacter sp. SD-b]|uniref:Alpha/beta hydrolase n=1 Tax=Pedobacter segetis TaxID=2793069 RepID=A0ABS1BL65_9SPHI|nr:alpha/beta hydrolase [Pedobacter segetis]MBK0383617.1 alpha/beta hydrolase [Pedobacter segetis]
MKNIKILTLLIVFAAFYQTDLLAQSITDKDENILKTLNYQDSIIYKKVNGEELKMIIFMPKNKKYKKTPFMVFTHGGGWAYGDRYVILKDLFFKPLQFLLDSGIACASIEYRLNRGGNKVVDAVTDCKDAVKFLVKNADKFDLDVSKIGVWGGSAGGHLSLMTGLAYDRYFKGETQLAKIHPTFKCIVSYFPQTTFTDTDVLHATNYLNAKKLEEMMGSDQTTAKLLSPVNYIKKGNPPILLIHGTNDTTLSYLNSTYFLSKAKEAGSDVTLLTVKNAGHGLNGRDISPSIDEVSKQVSDFMAYHLLNR